MAVSKRLRFEILRRDGFRCRYCGLTAASAELRVDHVIPEALGGTDDPSNLVTACEPCNTGKSSIAPDSPILADVQQDALRWARALKLLAEDRAEQRTWRVNCERAFADEWGNWTDRHDNEIPLPANWRHSFARFLAAGLELDDLIELIDVAMSSRAKDTWTYFCGCAWQRVRETHEAARLLLEDPTTTQEAHCGA